MDAKLKINPLDKSFKANTKIQKSLQKQSSSQGPQKQSSRKNKKMTQEDSKCEHTKYGIELILKIVHFINSIHVNPSLQSGLVNMLNSYMTLLQGSLEPNRYIIHGNKTLSNLQNPLKLSNITEKHKVTSSLDQKQQSNLKDEKPFRLMEENKINQNKLSLQNMKGQTSSRVLLPKINQKLSNVFYSSSLKLQEESQRLQKSSLKTQKHNNLPLNRNQDVQSNKKHIKSRFLEQRNNYLSSQVEKQCQMTESDKIKQIQDKIIQSHLANQQMLDNTINFNGMRMACEQIIFNLKERLRNHQGLVSKLQSKIEQFQTMSKCKENKRNILQLKEETQQNYVQLRQPLQIKPYSQVIYQKIETNDLLNKQIEVLRKQLKQRQEELTNLWFVVSQQNQPVMSEQNNNLT